MNIKEKVFNALNASTDLTNLLAKDAKNQCVFHCRSPSAKNYPVIVYSMTKDEPAVIADGTVIERRVTIRISILTKDGVTYQIFKEVWKVMAELGFMFVQSTESVEANNLFVNSIDFKVAIGGNE